jgi:hypothetical protein
MSADELSPREWMLVLQHLLHNQQQMRRTARVAGMSGHLKIHLLKRDNLVCASSTGDS